MIVELPCGRGGLELRVPSSMEDRVTVWRTKTREPLPDPVKAIQDALARPLGAPGLSELARGKKSACVVISDITRPAPNRLLLPPILKGLQEAGIGRENICILIATGMHDPTGGAALIELVGREIAQVYNIVNHDCHDDAGLREVTCIEGWPIKVNRRYLDAELKILTGLIEPHPFAGYSGGGKSILPGISSFDTMRFMHSFALLDDPKVAAARLAGNPFQAHVQEAARAAGVDLALNVVQDKQKRLAGVFAGGLQEVFDSGCKLAARLSVISPPAWADLVVTTAGGYPLDATLYQSSKGLITASQVLEPGGKVIWVSGCERGLGGETFVRMVSAHPDYDSFSRHYGQPHNFTIDQWGAQAYFQAMRQAGEVWLHSPGLTPEDIRPFGLRHSADLNRSFTRLAGSARTIYILPEGPYMACRPA